MGIDLHFGRKGPQHEINRETELPEEGSTARTPLTRAQRERVPDQMAAELMDFFINTINDMSMLNPVRDGIPQCVNHPFNPALGKVGCIHSCAKRDENLSLDVVRDYTLGDVWNWVRALVRKGVGDAERNHGWHRTPDATFLTKR